MGVADRILVVDDNEELAINLKEILEMAGYEVEIALTGKEAAEKCRQTTYEVVLVDIRLPDINGIDLIVELNEIRDDLLFIIMTAHASLESAVAAVGRNGIVAYEIKPLDVNRLVFLVKEIIGRKEAQRALKESEEYTRALLGSVRFGIMVIDEQSRKIVDVNPEAANLIGLPIEKIIGTVCHRFVCPKEEGACPIIDEGQDVNNSDRVLLKGDGTEVPILKTAVRAPLKGGNFLIESFIDISERKRMEEELRLAKESAEAAIRVRNEFLVHMNNEVRLPMTSIAGMMDMLLGSELGEEQRKYAESINDAFEALLTIVNDIVDLSGVSEF